MSGPLLLGIAAFGVGWAWLHRKPEAPPTPDTATPANDASDIDTVGSPQMLPPVSVPVEGSDGGQVIKTTNIVEGDTVVIDHKAETGGADPATQRTAVSDNKGSDSPPLIVQGDNVTEILAAKYGDGAGNGLTTDQISRAVAESVLWTQEVY